MRRHKGFTLLELLVVVAVIGFLSMLLFPVIARARQASRDDKCMANVKAIAAAIQMYAADYGALFPTEHDRRVLDYFNSGSGRGTITICSRAPQANPYLRPAVLLSSYLPDRVVWQCPSAKVMSQAAWIIPPGPNGDWLQGYVDHQGEWGYLGGWGESGLPSAMGPCYLAFPSGWGGVITDSFAQGGGVTKVVALYPGPQGGAFTAGIQVNSNLVELTRTEVSQPSRFISCGDCGRSFDIWDAQGIALPDTCGTIYCGGSSCLGVCTNADWENCSWSKSCGVPAEINQRLLTDGDYRNGFTRHHGGSNVGFLDGHAKWCAADQLLTRTPPFSKPLFEGLCSCWIGNGVMG